MVHKSVKTEGYQTTASSFYDFSQNEYEILLDDMKKKDEEFKELKEFTAFERQYEKETISQLKEVRDSRDWLS